MNSQNNLYCYLKTPLYRRGRPKSLRPHHARERYSQASHQHSSLSLLHQQNKITTDQYNAAETFLWILAEARKNLPLPRLSQFKYQEKVTGIYHEINLKNEDYIKKIFKKWHQSIDALKNCGPLTKELLEEFIWHNDRQIEDLSPVELQLIKRGLDALAIIYQT